MRRIIRYIIMALLVYFTITPAWSADEPFLSLRKRWEIDFSYQPIRIFTYNDPLNIRQNYWYCFYTLSNQTKETIKLNIDICLKANVTVTNAQPETAPVAASGFTPKLTAQYYQDSYQPVIETEIISAVEKLGGFPLAIRQDTIAKFKEKLRYLNCRDLRERKEIKPNETIECIALFSGIDSRSDELELMIGGLVAPVKQYYEKNNPKLFQEYESKIRWIVFSWTGDEFTKQHSQSLEIKKDWLIRNYGPIGDKETVSVLIDALTDENPIVRWVAWWLLRRLTDNTFDYNPELAADSDVNKVSINNWREWWYLNREKLTYNQALNKFEPIPPK